MKILVTGANGQLGKSIRKVFSGDPSLEVIYTDVAELDITDREEVDHFIRENKLDFIINCAAYTAVDKAEKDDLRAAAINTGAVGNIAQAAARHKVKVIHISTDYVFNGENYRPYEENDEPYPRSIYGRTKLEGEGILTSFCTNSLIIRTAWLYSEFGGNFVASMLRLASERPSLNVVSDQIGSPTYAGDLAEAIHHIIKHDKWLPGIYHYTNEGVASWFDFSKAIFEIAGKKVEVNPIPSSQYPTPAKRPLYSVLGKMKIKNTYGVKIPYWRDSLKKCLALMGNH
ncbi:MAG: dTDP-4-dehydrorhamnose reductase [Bacteroidales bacterium]|nr:dTDP-4-dehydrorhamnose reductase [Bacteroidales bacterium]MDE6537034.1 dTDP-4-dehydrorhamnose reductase [Muribaculaceae bacterium]MDE6836609.1 dTDP-4-dehydrorhamnose reductase [Muribaculaceae bacterium]MDE6867004.1 dTDP-4-dehydrorhamnose reductase [Muribaculaceae bacterium]